MKPVAEVCLPFSMSAALHYKLQVENLRGARVAVTEPVRTKPTVYIALPELPATSPIRCWTSPHPASNTGDSTTQWFTFADDGRQTLHFTNAYFTSASTRT